MTFPTTSLKDYAKKELVQMLDSVRGRKGLVLDPSLSGSMSLIAEFSLLKEHGVEKIYHLQAGPLETECKALIYVCRPTIKNMHWIALQIKHHATSSSSSIDYSLFFVPRRSMVCEMVLEEEGVFGSLAIGELHLDLIPLDDDLLSLEMDHSFKDLFVDGDTSCIYALAKAIMKLQTVYGIIPNVVGKGYLAKHLSDLLVKMRRELMANVDEPGLRANLFPPVSEIDSIIIIDRSVDLVTPMCTQLTYEGLIDEVFGLKSTFVELDPSFIAGNSGTSAAATAASSSSAATPAGKPRKVPLNSTDKLHLLLRDLNFAVVSGHLNQMAKRLYDDYEERHQAKTVSQIKDFIGKLTGLQAEQQSLRIHINITEQISKTTMDQDFNKMLEIQQNIVAGIMSQSHLDYIEEMIAKQMPLNQVLRLLCLYSLVSGGLKSKLYDFFRREIAQTYGYHHLMTLQNLESAGLFRKLDSGTSSSSTAGGVGGAFSSLPATLTAAAAAAAAVGVGGKNAYSSIRRSLRLIVDDVNEHNPNDISYVYSGFAPISVRLVQVAATKSVDSNTISSSTPVSVVGATGQQQQGGGSGGSSSSSNVGWKGWEDALKSLPGPTFEQIQHTDTEALLVSKKSKTPRGKVSLVVFIGGCTYTEVAATRFLAQQDEAQREFIIVTTNMLNGSTVIDQLTEKVPSAAAFNQNRATMR